MSPEAELIRALAEDLALEVLASYRPDAAWARLSFTCGNTTQAPGLP